MRLISRAIFALALGITTLPAASLAQQSDAAEHGQENAQQADAHENLYDVLYTGLDQEKVLDGMIASTRSQLRADPTLLDLDTVSPGLIDEAAQAIRPALAKYSERVRILYRPRVVQVLRDGLTADEAREITGFYATPVGQAVIAGISANYRPDAVLGTITTDRQVTAGDIEADAIAATRATVRGLTTEEMEELGREAILRPAILKLGPLRPRLNALRAEMEEAPTTAAEDKAVDSAIRAVFEKRFPDMPLD